MVTAALAHLEEQGKDGNNVCTGNARSGTNRVTLDQEVDDLYLAIPRCDVHVLPLLLRPYQVSHSRKLRA
jgi:hypothetical protein